MSLKIRRVVAVRISHVVGRVWRAAVLVAAMAGSAQAQVLDLTKLEADVGDAKAGFFRVFKLALGGVAVIIVILGIAHSAKAMSDKEQHAVWRLVGTLGGAVLLGVAMALL